MNVAVQVVVPAAAVLMLFALGLTLDGAQLARLFQQPRALLIGLACRWLVVPGLAVALCLLDRPAPHIALGLLLVASCPPATPAPARRFYAARTPVHIPSARFSESILQGSNRM